MPAIGDSKVAPKRLAENLIVGSIIHGPLLDEKKGKYRRVTAVTHRTGLIGFRTTSKTPTRVPTDCTVEKQRQLRDAADDGSEWFELRHDAVVV